MIALDVPGGRNSDFSEAFARVIEICQPNGITPDRPAEIVVSPRDGYIRINLYEDQLSETQLKELMIFKITT